MLAGGNTVVFSPHPRSKGVSIWLIKKLNAKLEELGAPRNLIVTVKEPSIENTNIMMNHPKVRMLVATGGPGIVKAVMSTGKKAIGAGAGNPPVVVDETADIEKAAKDLSLIHIYWLMHVHRLTLERLQQKILIKFLIILQNSSVCIQNHLLLCGEYGNKVS